VRRRSLIFYALLLFFPALAVGVAAIRSLRLEQDRVRQTALLAVHDRAGVLADRIDRAVRATKADLTDQLGALSAAALEEDLLDWQDNDPLLRSVFVWSPDTGLLLPDPHRPASQGETRFLHRFEYQTMEKHKRKGFMN